MTNGICKRIFLKENEMSAVERTGYSSDLYGEDDELVQVHSPTDTSEDSVEVKVIPISLRNKRKAVDPKEFNYYSIAPPPKKRMCLKISEEERKNAREPFRPWNITDNKQENPCGILSPTLRDLVIRNPPPIHVPVFKKGGISDKNDLGNLPKAPSPLEPLPLVKKSSQESEQSVSPITRISASTSTISSPPEETLRVPFHPSFASMGNIETERALQKSSETFPSLQVSKSPDREGSFEGLGKPTINVKNLEHLRDHGQSVAQRREQRNYKNMTRERRIEANARERTRVHTISAAFDTLRRSIPSYSHNQKLSKLSVLRIACSYIATLSNIVTDPDELSENSLAECVESVTRTIQREGKLRKKKDESD